MYGIYRIESNGQRVQVKGLRIKKIGNKYIEYRIMGCWNIKHGKKGQKKTKKRDKMV